MFQYFAIATAIVAVCNAANINLIGRADEDVVQVDIYYTSMCTDAASFITNQFVPTFEALADHMYVTYIPYGKSETTQTTDANGNTSWNFTCQFGAADCQANKEHACAINNILTNTATANQQQSLATFIACTFTTGVPEPVATVCLALMGSLPTTIVAVTTCAASTEGDALLAAHGNTTAALQSPLNFVPTIVINKEFSQANQDDSLANFKGVICQNIPAASRPTACSGSASLHTKNTVFAIFIFSLIFYAGKGTNFLF